MGDTVAGVDIMNMAMMTSHQIYNHQHCYLQSEQFVFSLVTTLSANYHG